MTEQLTGTAAGVPYVITPPWTNDHAAPIVVAWHLLDPPCTEIALAAALPLHGLAAWRIYLGLPMSGSRLPEGGHDELMRRAFEDGVLQLHDPIATQALAEFEPALAELRERYGLTGDRIGVVGGSIGGAIAALVLTESAVEIDVAVLINPLIQLSRGHQRDQQAVQCELSVDRRVQRGGRPARLRRAGARDRQARSAGGAPDRRCRRLGRGVPRPGRTGAARTRRPLPRPFSRPGDFVEGMAHAFADEPGVEPAPQTPQAVEVDRIATDWLNQHLVRER